MSERLQIRLESGWFPAGEPLLEALPRLSDGAFKLFVYLCLKARRSTGCLQACHGTLAAALGKSRRSILVHLRELEEKGICLLRPAVNQHQAGCIEVRDAYWPYRKQQRAIADSEQAYVRQAERLFAASPAARGCFSAADRQLAARLFGQGTALGDLEHALMLGSARKLCQWLNGLDAAPVGSLAYFLPVLEEIAQTAVSDSYWEHVRRRLCLLQQRWSAKKSAQAACENLAQAEAPSGGNEMIFPDPLTEMPIDSSRPPG